MSMVTVNIRVSGWSQQFKLPDSVPVSRMLTQIIPRLELPGSPDEYTLWYEDRRLSGSDIESVVLAANLLALRDGREAVTRDDLDRALGDFVPSAQGLEREAQELAAVIACTQLSFLPETWRERVAKPNGRVAIHELFVAIRQILEE